MKYEHYETVYSIAEKRSPFVGKNMGKKPGVSNEKYVVTGETLCGHNGTI